jgi:hypothetical protein
MQRLAIVSSITIQRMVRGYIMRCRAGREVAQARLKVPHIALLIAAMLKRAALVHRGREQFLHSVMCCMIVILIKTYVHVVATVSLMLAQYCRQHTRHLMLLRLLTVVSISCCCNVCLKQLEAANAHARANPGMTLGARVASALDALERGTQLTQIIRACITLELSTRYSKVSVSL